MDSAGTVPTVTKIHDLYELPTADTSRSSFVHSGLSQTEYNSNAPWALVRDAPVEGESLDSCVTPGIAQHSAHLGRCALSHGRGLAPTTGGGGATPVTGVLSVDILQPTKKPRGKELTSEQKAGNREVSRRRVRIEHVNSSVKRCRMLKETIRMWKEGMRDMVMEIGCALHNFRVRVTPSWTPLV